MNTTLVKKYTPDELAKIVADGRASFELGDALRHLVDTHTPWADATFGTPAERGPRGPLLHLSKEALEARENPSDISEFADCLLLWLDSLRRAGHTVLGVIAAAEKKMVENRARTWVVKGPDDPIEHAR